MDIVKGNIIDLLKWWQEPEKEYKFSGTYSYHFYRDKGPDFLCLLVGGSLKDKSYFKEIIENHSLLDNVSGKQIGIILFLDNHDNFLEWIDRNRMKVVQMDGEVLEPKKFDVKNRYSERDIWVSRVTEMDMNSKMKEQILQSTLNSFTKIREYFNIGIHEIPCMILINKNLDNWIIHTKEEESVKDFIKFLKKLAATIESEKGEYFSYSDLKYFEFPKDVSSEIKVIEEEIEATLNNKETLINELLDRLKNFGLPKEEGKEIINSSTIPDLWKIIRMSKHPPPPYALNYSKIFDEAKKDKLIIICASQVIESEKKVNKLKKDVENLKSKYQRCVNRHKELLVKKEEIEKRLEYDVSLHKKIDSVCNSFERKYAIRYRTKPIRKLIEAFFGFTDKTKELLDLQEKLKKVIK